MGQDRWHEHMQNHMDGGFGVMGGGMGGAGWWVGGLLMILLTVAVVAVVVALVAGSNRTANRPQAPVAGSGGTDGLAGQRSSRDPAEALLRDRFARGDIDDREYDQRLAMLRRG